MLQGSSVEQLGNSFTSEWEDGRCLAAWTDPKLSCQEETLLKGPSCARNQNSRNVYSEASV